MLEPAREPGSEIYNNWNQTGRSRLPALDAEALHEAVVDKRPIRRGEKCAPGRQHLVMDRCAASELVVLDAATHTRGLEWVKNGCPDRAPRPSGLPSIADIPPRFGMPESIPSGARQSCRDAHPIGCRQSVPQYGGLFFLATLSCCRLTRRHDNWLPVPAQVRGSSVSP